MVIGRPHLKSWTSTPDSLFSCSPGDGEKLLDRWAYGHKGLECPQEIETQKVYVHVVPSFLRNLEGPTCKPRHASVFSTHSDTQAVPAFHCEYELFKSILFNALAFLKRTDTLSTIA